MLNPNLKTMKNLLFTLIVLLLFNCDPVASENSERLTALVFNLNIYQSRMDQGMKNEIIEEYLERLQKEYDDLPSDNQPMLIYTDVKPIGPIPVPCRLPTELDCPEPPDLVDREEYEEVSQVDLQFFFSSSDELAVIISNNGEELHVFEGDEIKVVDESEKIAQLSLDLNDEVFQNKEQVEVTVVTNLKSGKGSQKEELTYYLQL